MERISGELAMKILFSIKNQPISFWGPKLYSEIEGELSIFIDDKLIFNESGILLLEFAHYLARWLSALEKGDVRDFTYESMDYEDCPIIEFKYRDGNWDMSSIWIDKQRTKYTVLHNTLIYAVRRFINELRDDLSGKICLDGLL